MLILQNIKRSYSTLSSYELISKNLQSPYSLRATKEIPLFSVKHGIFKSSFFPATIIEWNKLDHYLRNAPSITAFKH